MILVRHPSEVSGPPSVLAHDMFTMATGGRFVVGDWGR